MGTFIDSYQYTFKALVAFIRKRDPRVHAHKKELVEKRLEQERKTEENRKLKILQQLR